MKRSGFIPVKNSRINKKEKPLGQTNATGKSTFAATIRSTMNKSKKSYSDNSLFIFKESNCFRRSVITLIESRYFDYLVMFVIFLNSMALALYDYSDRDSLLIRNKILEIAGTVFTIIFALESLLKIIALGFLFHKNAYLRDGWNIVDFFVVCSG